MLDEFERIRHWTASRRDDERQRVRGVVVGIGDDAAVVDPHAAGGQAGRDMVLAMDTMVETVHFNAATMDEADIGWKALAANVSDIAAMGAEPLHALVSVSVPPSCGPDRMQRLFDGLYACAERYGVAVIGGDTTSSPAHLVVAVTVTGAVEAGRTLIRGGARPGDTVFVTGPVGMSAAGLHWLLAASAGAADGGCVPLAAAEAAGTAALVRAHRRPEPSVAAGRLLAAGGCTSLNDVSDGLASEAWEIAAASGAAIVLREASLPRSGSLAAYAAAVAAAAGSGRTASGQALEWMLYGGEDYALVGTAPPAAALQLQEAFQQAGLPFYPIGIVEAGEPGVYLEPAGGRKRQPLAKRGFNHFG